MLDFLICSVMENKKDDNLWKAVLRTPVSLLKRKNFFECDNCGCRTSLDNGYYQHYCYTCGGKIELIE